ncbi:MAG: hypothetical protein HOO06_01365 [Bdellovibrionaceae bacterium]|nr:hypothetical protein [Pseudobdellovibrionaceae bacterium]
MNLSFIVKFKYTLAILTFAAIPFVYNSCEGMQSGIIDQALAPSIHDHQIPPINDNQNNNGNNSPSLATGNLENSKVCTFENQIHVSINSTASFANCGSASSPCRTISDGIEKATEGQAVCIHAGTYNEDNLLMKTGVWLISADGPGEAKIFSDLTLAIRFRDVNDTGIDGLDIFGTWNSKDEGLELSERIEGLIRITGTNSNIKIYNSMIHDAPYDADVIKVSGATNGLIFDHVIAWSPGRRPPSKGTPFQEVIDLFGSYVTDSNKNSTHVGSLTNIIVRNSWLFHVAGRGDYLIYSKFNMTNVLYENNIFGPTSGASDNINSAVGIGTGETTNSESGGLSPYGHVYNAIVRNNIFTGTHGDAALSVCNSTKVWVHNNLFYNNTGDNLRSVMMLRGNYPDIDVEDLHVHNNMYIENYPNKKNDPYFIWDRDGPPVNFSMSQNYFYNNTSSSDITYVDDNASIYEDRDFGLSLKPLIPDPESITISSIHKAKQAFLLKPGSAPEGKGVNLFNEGSYPSFNQTNIGGHHNFLGEERPTNEGWNMGVE